MDESRLSKWLMVTSNIAVLLGLVFLIVELRQSNQIAIGENEIALRDSFGLLNESTYISPEFADLIVRAGANDETLTTVERFRIRQYVRQLFNVWVSAEIAYDNGMLSELTYNAIFEDATGVVNSSSYFRENLRFLLDAFESGAEMAIVMHLNEALAALD